MRALRVLLSGTLLLAALAAGAEDLPAQLFGQSYAQEARGDYTSALASVEQAGLHGASDYMFQLRRAWLLYLNKRYQDSADAYAHAIALAPNALEPKLGAMLPLMALRHWNDAEQRCEEVLKIAPNEYLALSRLAYIHYQQGRYAKAEGFYRQVLALYPSNVEMRAGLGWSLLQQGKKQLAAQEFQAVLDVAPDYATALQGLAAARP